ncbi:MAG: hypothetical protein Q8R12_00465 [bacterium]|nr:hypothetical protein [bacterium]
MADKQARPKLGNEPWRVRFSSLTSELSVQLGLVFIGPSAMIADTVLDWPADFKHYQEGEGAKEPVCKLYVNGYRGKFSLPDLDPLLYRVAYIDWTFLRSQDSRAVCAPRPIPRHYLTPDVLTSIDVDAAEKALWGFGRPNAYKPDAKVHQALSGALVDYIPGREPENRKDWVFAPVFIRVQPDNGIPSYIAKLYPMWPGKNSVFMMCDTMSEEFYSGRPAEFPQELVAYEFGPRSSERPAAGEARPSGRPTAVSDTFEEIARRSVRHARR